MNKKVVIISSICIFLIALGITLFFIFGLKEKDNPSEQYTINYYVGYWEYVIKTKANKLIVTKNEVIQCIKAPCPPRKVDSFKVKYTDEYRKLIDELFEGKEEKTITVSTSDLSDEQTIVLNKLVKYEPTTPKTTEPTTYPAEVYVEKYEKRGFYVLESNDKYIITIAMGKRNTGGYSISIDHTEFEGDTLHIYVKETSPNPADTVTQVISYPTVKYELDEYPENVIVTNVDNGSEFKLIN